MGKMTSTKTLMLTAMATAALVGIALPSLASAQDSRGQTSLGQTSRWQDWRGQGASQDTGRTYGQANSNSRQSADRGTGSDQRSYDQSRNERDHGVIYHDDRGTYADNDRRDRRDARDYDRYDRVLVYHVQRRHDWHRDHRGW